MRKFYSYMTEGLGRLGSGTGVTVRVQAGSLGKGDHVDLRLVGPGHVKGLAPGVVGQVHPAPGSADMRGGELAWLRLQDPTLAWALTPDVPEDDRLMPWLGVLCVPADLADMNTAAQPLPVLSCRGLPPDMLPDPRDYALTTHVEDPEASAETSAGDGPGPQAFARLMCPQKLEKDTQYLAVLVPLYAEGIRAGMGVPAGDLTDFAWATGDTELVLPVYHFWQFSTGAGRGAEDILRSLQPVTLDGAPLSFPVDPRFSDTAPGLQTVDAPNRSILTTGAVTPPQDLQALVPALSSTTGDTVRLPITNYGRVFADDQDAGQSGTRKWYAEVNRDLGLRVLAGTGAAMVRERQEELVAFMTSSAGPVAAINQVLDDGHFAMLLGDAVHKRVAACSDDAVLVFAGPAAERTRLQDGTSLARNLRGTAQDAARHPAIRQMLDGAADGVASTISDQGDTISLADDIAGASPFSAASWAGLLATGQSTAGNTINRDTDMGPLGIIEMFMEGIVRAELLDTDEDVSQAWSDTTADAADTTLFPRRQPPLKAHDEVPDLAQQTISALLPKHSISPRLRDRIGGLDPDKDVPSKILVDPVWPEAVFEAMFEQDPALLAPGLKNLPTDAVVGLVYDPVAMEAVMVGANHELQRELRWRGVPVGKQASPFRRAFPAPHSAGSTQDRTDILPLSQWGDTPIGTHADPSFDLGFVAIMRSDLVKRFPGTAVMLVRALMGSNGKRDLQPNAVTFGKRNHLMPILQGTIGRDLMYFGFPNIERPDIEGGTLEGANESAHDDQGWFLVFRTDAGGQTFGLGAGSDSSDWQAGRPWGELAWSDLERPNLSEAAFGTVPDGAPVLPTSDGITWASSSAHMAQILMERPVIVGIHLSDIIT